MGPVGVSEQECPWATCQPKLKMMLEGQTISNLPGLPFLLRFLWGISDVQPRPQHNCLSLAKALAHLTPGVYPEGSAATALASSQPTTLPKLYLGHNS